LLMDVHNEGKGAFNLAISIFTRGGYGFYESTGRYIKKGSNKDVMFDLRSERFKSAQTGWAYKTAIKDPSATTAIVLMIYPRAPGVVHIDNVRFVKVKKK